MKSELVTVTAGAIIRRGRILAARRYIGAARGGLWELPGGKVEPGETSEQCLRRELDEELGVQVQVGDLLAQVVHPYPELTIRLQVYSCRLMGGEPEAKVHDALAWLNAVEALALEWSPADQAVVGVVVKAVL